jgi:two-component system sensor histidine kinase SenX3
MRSHASTDALRDSFEADVVPAREELDRAIVDLAAMQEQQLLRATRRAKDTVSSSLGLLGVFAGVGVAASMVFGMYLTRALSALGAQRAETERQLQRVNEVNADLDAFAGRVAHDLRNLISPLSLVAELMRDSTHSEPQVKPLAARLERTVDRSITMLDGLLAFSRSSKPGPGVACSVRPVLADVIDQLAPLARKVDAQVEIEAENVKVSCSRELLHVLASNLIGNALKFIDVRPRRVVKVAATAVGSSCELSVSDTGPGIPAAALDRIFEPFYRVPGSRAGGTGIGLATVQRIVAAHGGRITVKSFVDQGTTFRVELPLAAEAPAGS